MCDRRRYCSRRLLASKPVGGQHREHHFHKSAAGTLLAGAWICGTSGSLPFSIASAKRMRAWEANFSRISSPDLRWISLRSSKNSISVLVWAIFPLTCYGLYPLCIKFWPLKNHAPSPHHARQADPRRPRRARPDRAGTGRPRRHQPHDTIQHRKGAPSPEIGIVFEVASIVGVRLFDYDERALQMHNARLDEKLTLLPKSVRHSVKEVDDDF